MRLVLKLGRNPAPVVDHRGVIYGPAAKVRPISFCVVVLSLTHIIPKVPLSGAEARAAALRGLGFVSKHKVALSAFSNLIDLDLA